MTAFINFWSLIILLQKCASCGGFNANASKRCKGCGAEIKVKTFDWEKLKNKKKDPSNTAAKDTWIQGKDSKLSTLQILHIEQNNNVISSSYSPWPTYIYTYQLGRGIVNCCLDSLFDNPMIQAISITTWLKISRKHWGT